MREGCFEPEGGRSKRAHGVRVYARLSARSLKGFKRGSGAAQRSVERVQALADGRVSHFFFRAGCVG